MGSFGSGSPYPLPKYSPVLQGKKERRQSWIAPLHALFNSFSYSFAVITGWLHMNRFHCPVLIFVGCKTIEDGTAGKPAQGVAVSIYANLCQPRLKRLYRIKSRYIRHRFEPSILIKIFCVREVFAKCSGIICTAVCRVLWCNDRSRFALPS